MAAATPVQVIRNDYSSTNVTTSAWVELDAALDNDVQELEVFDSSGESFQLAIGAENAEVELDFYILPGGILRQCCKIPKGARLAIKAISGNATTGEIILNMWS